MPFSTSSPITTFIFLIVFTIAFFPGLFVTLIELPFRPFLWSPRASRSPTCAYTSPASCTIASTSTPTSAPGNLDAPAPTMSWFQKQISLPSKSRGSYLITSHIESSLPEIREYKVGLLNLFIQHTSCALSLNENWDEDVRADMSDALDRIVPEDRKGGLYRHDAEGSDDMPAHVKSALVGASVTIPISNGRLATGTWQGIWYLEFRAAKHSRKVVATIQGEKM